MFRSNLPQLVARKAHEERRKITQVMIASETGISANTISAWMQPRRNMPRLDGATVQALMDWLDCSLDELVEVTDSPDPTLVPVG